MRISVFWGYVEMMKGLVSRMRARIGWPIEVISTGGLAVLLDTHGDIFDALVPDQTTEGLALMYEWSLRP